MIEAQPDNAMPAETPLALMRIIMARETLFSLCPCPMKPKCHTR
jgi:hypothetical protein